MISSPVPYMTERVPCASEARPQAMSWLGAPDLLCVLLAVQVLGLLNLLESEHSQGEVSSDRS